MMLRQCFFGPQAFSWSVQFLPKLACIIQLVYYMQKALTETPARSVLPEVTVPSMMSPEIALRTVLPKTGTKQTYARHQPKPAKRQNKLLMSVW